MDEKQPPPLNAEETRIAELISDITSGKASVFDLITSAPKGDYRAHVDMMRLAGVVLSDVRVAKALLAELQVKITDHPVGPGDSEEIEKQLARKDGHRRFNKLIAQRAEAFRLGHSFLSGDDFESCLQQYKALLSHVEEYWASAAQEFKMGKFPIATFLAILVIEEVGKLALLHRDLVWYDAPRPAQAPQGVDRNHRRKHFIGVVSGALINARLDRILGKDVVKRLLHEAESDELENTRQACLYIDVRAGLPVTPAQQIGEERARTLVILAGELMAEVLGHFPWEFERMLNAVMTFEEEIGLPLHKVARR